LRLRLPTRASRGPSGGAGEDFSPRVRVRAAIAAAAFLAAGFLHSATAPAGEPEAGAIEIAVRFPPLVEGGGSVLREALPVAAEGEPFHHRAGAWFAFAVHAANLGSSEIEAAFTTSPVSLYGTPMGSFRARLKLPPSSRKAAFLYAVAPPDACLLEIRCEWKGGTRVIRHPLTPLPPDSASILLADRRGAARKFFSSSALWQGPFCLFLAGPEELPDRPEGFHAYDRVALPDDADLSAAQSAAIGSWVRGGGRVLLYAGPGEPSSAARSLFPFPGQGTEIVAAPDEPAFRSIAGAPLRLRGIAVAGGQVLARASGTALLARRLLGAGEVTVLAADPAAPPFPDWSGSGDFFGRTLPAASGLSERDLAAIAGDRTARSPCEPSILPLAGFLALGSLAFGPAGFFLLRRTRRWGLALASLAVVGAAFLPAAFLFGRKAMDSGPSERTFVILHARAGSDGGLAETYLTSARCARAPLDLAGPGGELAAPVHRENADRDPAWEAWTEGRPVLSYPDLPAGVAARARIAVATDRNGPEAGLEFGAGGDLAGTVDLRSQAAPEEAAAVFGNSWYLLAPPAPGRIRDGSGGREGLLTPSGKASDAGEFFRSFRPPRAERRRGRRGRREPEQEIPLIGSDALRGASWFDPDSGRIVLEGWLVARWSKGEREDRTDPDLLLCRVRAGLPPGILRIPPGLLRGRWMKEDGADLEEGPGPGPRPVETGVRVPPGEAAVVEFVLPVPGDRLADVAMDLGWTASIDGDLPMPSEGGAPSPSVSTAAAVRSFFVWSRDAWGGPEGGLEAVRPVDGRVRCRFSNPGKEGMTVRLTGLGARGRFE
jgi:hypothetical protein